MEFKHTAAVCILSATAVMLISPLLCRIGRKQGIFSAALGIILYRIVKSIIVECGWGFAAAAGIRTGMMMEAMTMCCGLVLFGEIGKTIEQGRKILPAAAVMLLSAGKGLMCDAGLMPSSVEYIIGRAAGTALIATAVGLTGNEGEAPDAKSLTAFAVFCSAGCFASEWIISGSVSNDPSLIAPFFIMLGCCGLMKEFAEVIRNAPPVLPAGFAAGMLLSYGFDCLTG